MIRLRVCAVITAASLVAAAPLAAQQNASTRVLVDRVQTYLDEWRTTATFPGASVGVVLKDGTSFGVVTGVSDRAAGTPMRVDDLLLAGSTGKTFFAAVAVQLIEQGRLDLDAPVSKYLGSLSWYSRLPNASTITVRQLMTHTSGLVRYEMNPKFTADLRAAPDKAWTPEEELSYLLDATPPFAAGAGWDYSDTNYIVLGMICERLTGTTLYDEVQRRFLGPLKLTRVIPSIGRRIPGLIPGYAGPRDPLGLPDEVLVNGTFVINPQFEWTGGGYATSPLDLARWGHALYAGSALSAKARALMIDAAVPARLGPETRYGLGVIVRSSTPVGLTWGHSGFFPGYQTELLHVVDAGVTLAIQINSSAPRVTGGKSLLQVLYDLAAIVGQRQLPTVEETVTVSATRTGARLEDQPLRVEVLGREEIEEKMLMTPGDIVMMLNEMGGMRVQTTSPSLGAASVRIQGMRGRYTRFFSDGLPLFGEVGGLGLLQIPPMDLGQVEVIKGVASSLYGAGAMGGVVNLISRRPGTETEREILVNRSTRGATDLVTWYATPSKPGGWALTFLGGGHWQTPTDVDGDVWADLAGYSRGIVRPRVFWEDQKGRSFFATVGFTAENREGGTIDDAILPAAGVPYREALETRHLDAGVVGQMLVRQRYLVSARGAISQQRHDHQFGEIRERDRHDTAFGEVTIRAIAGRHTLIAGLAVERDAYHPRDVPQFAYSFVDPGVFGQADLEVTKWFSLSASGRLDWHSEYGTFFSPRVAALFRSGTWNSRLSIGTGFFGPTPLTEETEAAGLTRLVIPATLRAEEGRSASFDVSRTDGPFSYTVTLFGSRVAHPIHVDRSTGLTMTNLVDPATNVGLELLGTLRRAPFAVTSTYTYVRAREIVGGLARDAALTPRHSAGLVGMWEREDVGRVGVELYYTGAQAVEENPYRDTSEPYVIFGMLAERQFGIFRLFVNAENLIGVRQTSWDPLVRPSRAPDGRWTVDAWAPLDGRNINGGLRIGF